LTDIVDKATRSRMMSGIRGRDTRPEIAVRRFLHAAGLRFRLHVRYLPGRPDIVLPRYNSVVFVHGCFWHRHEGCKFAYAPKSRADFWREKFNSNVARDARDVEALKGAGWKVYTVWECEVTPTRLGRLVRTLRTRSERSRKR